MVEYRSTFCFHAFISAQTFRDFKKNQKLMGRLAENLCLLGLPKVMFYLDRKKRIWLLLLHRIFGYSQLHFVAPSHAAITIKFNWIFSHRFLHLLFTRITSGVKLHHFRADTFVLLLLHPERKSTENSLKCLLFTHLTDNLVCAGFVATTECASHFIGTWTFCFHISYFGGMFCWSWREQFRQKLLIISNKSVE